MGLLTNDTVVIETAGHYFYWVLAIPLAGFAAFLWDGILIGATATRFMLWAMLVASGSFFVIYYCFSGLRITICYGWLSWFTLRYAGLCRLYGAERCSL